MTKIIIDILVLIVTNIVMYGILIKINWNNDRYLYVKNDNKNIIGILLRVFVFFVIITLMVLVNPSILGIIFSGMIIISYVRATKIVKKRMGILVELIFTTFIFNLLIFLTIWFLILPNILLYIYNNTEHSSLDWPMILSNIFTVNAVLFTIYNFTLGYIRTRRFLTVENNFLKKYSKYYKGEKKEKFITKIYNNLPIKEKKEFIKNYCKTYENKEEYKNDKFNSINYKYFPIVTGMLIIFFLSFGLILGKHEVGPFYIEISLYYPSVVEKITGYILLTIILMYLVSILFIQSYLYNIGNSKIKNIRIKTIFRIEENCHPIFKEVYCYKNFQDFMFEKEMPQKPLGIRKFLLVISIGIVVIYLIKTSVFLINSFNLGIHLY